jgi:transposase InsO family protein
MVPSGSQKQGFESRRRSRDMVDERDSRRHERWAWLRFSIVGPLLSSPPAKGQLRTEIETLASKEWRHPITGRLTHFAASTIERWYYGALAAKTDPVAALRRKLRSDSGQQPSLNEQLRPIVEAQYRAHKKWSYQLHFDNLCALVQKQPDLGTLPSYASVRRYMKSHGLIRKRIARATGTAGAIKAEERLQTREVRSYESEYTNALWHLDFHEGSLKTLTPEGNLIKPHLLAILDDHSRLICHAQWYLGESAEELVHGLCQAFLKRGLPRALMSDNGSAMKAAETEEGLLHLGILHELTLDYSPYQNGKQESFWGQVEGRLLAMMEHCRDLTLESLNEATQAWVEMEYQRKIHSEIGQTPLQRFLESPGVGRDCPSIDDLRFYFCAQTSRRQRKSDGTISLIGIRYEIPGRYRHLERISVRYAGWDLSHVYMVDGRTGTLLTRLYPLDKARNADGYRRAFENIEPSILSETETAPQAGMAPLLRKLIEDYAATGLPPAYIPKTQREEP